MQPFNNFKPTVKKGINLEFLLVNCQISIKK